MRGQTLRHKLTKKLSLWVFRRKALGACVRSRACGIVVTRNEGEGGKEGGKRKGEGERETDRQTGRPRLVS